MNVKSDLNWDEYYMNLAFAVSLRSKDPSTKVGSIIVKNSTVAIGYNGFPIGVRDLQSRWVRPHKYKYVVHSEANALSNAQFDVSGGVIYISRNPPCNECTKLIIQNRLIRVVCSEMTTSHITRAHSDKSLRMLEEAGIIVDMLDFSQIYNKVTKIMSAAHGLK